MRSSVREMWEKRILTKFLVVEEIFGLLSVTLDAVGWHTTLNAPLTGSCCRTKNQSCCEHTRKKLARSELGETRTVIARQMGF
jgi:hypothetical protein